MTYIALTGRLMRKFIYLSFSAWLGYTSIAPAFSQEAALATKLNLYLPYASKLLDSIKATLESDFAELGANDINIKTDRIGTNI